MPTYMLFSIIAAFAFAFSSIVNKITSRHILKDKWMLLFYYYITYIPFVFLIPFLGKIYLPTDWAVLFFYSLSFFIGNVLFFTAIFRIDASTFAPFFQLQSVFIVILAFLFLGERFPISNYLWILSIIIGAVLISIDESVSLKFFFKMAIFLIILQQFFHALSNIFAGFTLKTIDFWNLNFWSSIISLILVITVAPLLSKFNLKVSIKQLTPLFATNFFSFIDASSLFYAFQTNLAIKPC